MKLLWLQLLAIQLVAALHLSPRSNSKRGVAFAQSNSADLPKAANGQCSWIYNWSPYLPSSPPRQPSLLPNAMGSRSNPVLRKHGAPICRGDDPGSSFCLVVQIIALNTPQGFNEPDRADQSNIPVGEAASLWKQRYRADPTASHGCTVSFSSAARSTSLRIHWYGDGAANFIGYLEAVHSQFPNMPIFVTEFASTSSNPPDVAEFLTAALQYLDTLRLDPGIQLVRIHSQRFSLAVEYALFDLLDGGGNLNKLGEEYI
ncbi:hypothetical protein C8F01DRAFT_1372425 [Mycena amicta]|nr:hypothetical protein C8F01DRAFT_1372425 [Mycena amicta]